MSWSWSLLLVGAGCGGDERLRGGGGTPGGGSPSAVLDTPGKLARAVFDRLADGDFDRYVEETLAVAEDVEATCPAAPPYSLDVEAFRVAFDRCRSVFPFDQAVITALDVRDQETVTDARCGPNPAERADDVRITASAATGTYRFKVDKLTRVRSGWRHFDTLDCSVPTEAPSHATIEIINAVVAPGKVDGTHWDGFGDVPTAVSTAIATYIGAAVAQPIIDYMLQNAADFLEKPDPIGEAHLVLEGRGPEFVQRLTNGGAEHEDTFMPEWRPHAAWTGVTLSPGLRIRVSLQDADLSDHDTIATVDLNMSDIQAALDAGQVHPVFVGDQNRQLLVVSISARRDN